MKKPYVICHMTSTINGKIISDNWGSPESIKNFSSLYERCHESFESNAWMVGRVTMEKHFAEDEKPKLVKPEKSIEKKSFIGDKEAKSFAIAVDARGKLFWDNNQISGDHIIEVLTEEASDDYLYYLQQKKISYIIAGKKEINFQFALQQLKELFHIDTLMLEGGGHINGSLLNEGLIDEISLLIVPAADNTPNVPTSFELGDYDKKIITSPLHLKEIKQVEYDVLWLKYTIHPKS